MLTIFNAQESERNELISSFKRVDERFKFVSIDHPERANLSIIQYQWLIKDVSSHDHSPVSYQ